MGRDNKCFIDLEDSGLVNIITGGTASKYTTAVNTGWNHILMSWQANSLLVYVNDADDEGTSLENTGDIDLTKTNWACMAQTDANNKVNADVFDYFFDDNFIDISSVSNRRKFIGAAGKPVDLGANGELPLGASPLVFLHIDDGEAANNFKDNAGTGGGMTLNGALTTAATSPTD